MKLLTHTIRRRLLANGRQQQALRGTAGEIDFEPVVKLFNPVGSATWLLTEIDPQEPDIAFGLCDLGFGCPELGSVSLAGIEAVRLPCGLGIERDLHFAADKPLSAYTAEAQRTGRIEA